MLVCAVDVVPSMSLFSSIFDRWRARTRGISDSDEILQVLTASGYASAIISWLPFSCVIMSAIIVDMAWLVPHTSDCIYAITSH
jgi:hypothetical protein